MVSSISTNFSPTIEHTSALKIQRWYRVIKQNEVLKNVSFKDKRQKNEIDRLVIAGDREGLKKMIYDKLSPVMKKYVYQRENTRLLTRVTADPDSYLSDMGIVFYQALQLEYDVMFKEMTKEEVRRGEYNEDRKRPYLGEQEKESPKDWVSISHGGGLNYITRFLAGEERGYNNNCIYVSPNLISPDKNIECKGSSRDQLYAFTAAFGHFDEPVVLTAKIKRKYLQRAGISFEAFLMSKNVRHLREVKITPLTITEKDLQEYSGLIAINEENMAKIYSKHDTVRLRKRYVYTPGE